MATQLSIYNGALRELGERKLASLSENTEPRRVLDDVYTAGVKYCLEKGHWKFAQRASKLSYTPSYTAPFGYSRQFTKPSDLVKVSKVCVDEYFKTPLLNYSDEAGFWFADLDDIYISYVSNDSSYGLDMALWPETFVLFVERYLATRILPRLKQNRTDLADMLKLTKDARIDALSKDAIQGPTVFPPTGSWVRSRGGNGGRGDRGNRGSLIG